MHKPIHFLQLHQTIFFNSSCAALVVFGAVNAAGVEHAALEDFENSAFYAVLARLRPTPNALVLIAPTGSIAWPIYAGIFTTWSLTNLRAKLCGDWIVPAISLMGFNLPLKLSIFSMVFVADVSASQALGVGVLAGFTSIQSGKQSKSSANAAGEAMRASVNATAPHAPVTLLARARVNVGLTDVDFILFSSCLYKLPHEYCCSEGIVGVANF